MNIRSLTNKATKNNSSKQDDIETFKDQSRFKPYVFNYAGYKVHLTDPLSFYWETKYIFEDEIYHFATKNKEPVIIDGGGNIGFSSMYFKRLYPKAKIMLFEPDQSVLKTLYQNIKDNKQLSDIKVIEKGLFNKDGQVSFDADQTDGGKIDQAGRNKIEITKLSNYIDGSVDFLKLNIEGPELEVCQDLDKSGKFKYVNQLCMEWHSFADRPQNLDEILTTLKRNGFRYYIGSFRSSPNGKFSRDVQEQFHLLIFVKRVNK